MILKESDLRAVIRKVIFESKKSNLLISDEEDDILGEPDLSQEDERENPKHEEDGLDEFSAIGASGGAPAGKIRGHVGRSVAPKKAKRKNKNL